jgi:hypothetical protein
VEEPSGLVTDPTTQRVPVHEVRERELAVDLDRREQLPVARLELGPPADVDQLEVEAELGMQFRDDLERPRAEAAVSGVIGADARYGYKPRVVVASATRCTASPYEDIRRLVR